VFAPKTASAGRGSLPPPEQGRPSGEGRHPARRVLAVIGALIFVLVVIIAVVFAVRSAGRSASASDTATTSATADGTAGGTADGGSTAAGQVTRVGASANPSSGPNAGAPAGPSAGTAPSSPTGSTAAIVPGATVPGATTTGVLRSGTVRLAVVAGQPSEAFDLDSGTKGDPATFAATQRPDITAVALGLTTANGAAFAPWTRAEKPSATGCATLLDTQWTNNVPLATLLPGANVCVLTSQGRTALFTVRTGFAVTEGQLYTTFLDFTVWKKPTD
jgi:hypothetical protein